MKNGIWTKTKQTEQFSVCMEELSLSNSHCSTTAWLLYDDDDDGTASWHLIEIIVCNHLKRLAGDMQATRTGNSILIGSSQMHVIPSNKSETTKRQTETRQSHCPNVWRRVGM